jgi:P4 family phage/plasmid primase-like protien
MSTENFLPKKTQIDFLNNFNFIYGSFKLDYIQSKDNKYCKIPTYIKKWKVQSNSFYDSKYNGIYVLTGSKSNIFVIDIDDEFKCPKLKNLLDDDCNLIVKTKKGFHYYYEYDSNINQSNQYSKHGFDIRSDGGLIYSPPTYYYDENNIIIKYEFIKTPINNIINKIDITIKKYLLELIKDCENNSKKHKMKKVIKDIEIIKEVKKMKDNFDTEYIKRLLKDKPEYKDQLKESLNDIITNMKYENHDSYIDWIKIGMGLKNFSLYGLSLWHKISSQSPKYNSQELEKQFNGFNNINDIGYGSFLYWLKEDNPEYYNTFYEKNKEMINYILKTEYEIEAEILENITDKGDIDIVEYYHKKFKDNIICTSKKSGEFYIYNDMNKLWEYKIDCDIVVHFLKNIFSILEPLIKHYENSIEYYKKNDMSDKSKTYTKLLKDIKKNPKFIDTNKAKQLLPLIKSTFYDNEFIAKLNNNPIVLPVKNGIINLETGIFRERTKYDYCSFELDVEWKGLDYNTDFINHFFKDIMLNNMDMIKYFQKFLGYSITGIVKEHKFAILWGCGGNGKSVLQNALKNLFSQYYRQLTSDVVIESNNNKSGSASPHLMQLLGTRLGFVDESENGAKLNEAIVKSITGGGTISARPLYGDIVNFEPTFHIFLLTNYKPEINVSIALRRRILLIPFEAQFVSQDKYDRNNLKHRLGDKSIEEKLINKKDELLVWLVHGSMRYFKEGLDDIDDTIQNATNEYMEENDDIGNFIKEYCILDKNSFTYHSEIYQLFRQNYNTPINPKQFTILLKNIGFELKRKTAGMVFIGIKINHTTDE